MRSNQQGTSDIRFTLFDNPDFTGNANAVCDYTITGTFDIDGGAINQPYTTIMAQNDHNHTYNTGSIISGFTITSVVPVCPCVNVIFNQITPTPSATPTLTPTPSVTQTNTPTMTSTPTNTQTSTPTGTLSITSTPTNTSTPTPTSFTQFGGSGRGNSVGEACSDAISNNRTFYSNCDGLTFGVGCYVYTDSSGTPLTGYTNVFMNLSSWDVNSSTGEITAVSSVQC
jgi:hypothetical protein